VYQWQEGHQADRYGNQQLDKYGLLNDKMDKLANQYREETRHMNLTPQQDYFRSRMEYMDSRPESHRRYPQNGQTTHSGNRNEQMACST
jgi:hypothetical protein